jgi:hypothetical protein
VFQPGPSPEELFARRFGYSLTAPPVSPYPDSEVAVSSPRPRSIQRRLTPFCGDEEGNLVVLPSPPLRKLFLPTNLAHLSDIHFSSQTRVFLAQYSTLGVAYALAAPRSPSHLRRCGACLRQPSVRPLCICRRKSNHSRKNKRAWRKCRRTCWLGCFWITPCLDRPYASLLL